MSYPKQSTGSRSATAAPLQHSQGGEFRSTSSGYPGLEVRSFNNPGTGSGFGGTPAQFGGYPGLGGSQLPVAQSTNSGGGGILSLLTGGGGSGGGSGFNIGQIKGIVDRLGGIEGIVDTFGKMQKVFQTVQQAAPMLKLLAGSFAKGKSSKGDDDGDGLATPVRRRRRRKRRVGSTTKVKRRKVKK